MVVGKQNLEPPEFPGAKKVAEPVRDGFALVGLVFHKGDKTATIKLEIIDDDEIETTEHFFVRLLRVEGGTLERRADLIKVRIKDDDTRTAAHLKHAPAYHCVEAVFTVFALVGRVRVRVRVRGRGRDRVEAVFTVFALVGAELAQRWLSPEHDEWVGHITLTCFLFFSFDMLLLHKVRLSARVTVTVTVRAGHSP